MKFVKLAICVLSLAAAQELKAQDLLQRVPQESQMVVALNGKAFFKHVELAEVNKLFKSLGFFEEVMGSASQLKSENLEDLGLDLRSKAYVYGQVTDSVQFVGGLFPLSNRGQFEANLPKNKKIETVDGLKTIYNSSRTHRISWDDQTVYVLTGTAMFGYFDQEDIKSKYGIEEQNDYYGATEVATVDDGAISAYDEAVDAAAYADSAVAIVDSIAVAEDSIIMGIVEVPEVDSAYYAIPPPAVPSDFDSVDSVLDQDEYQDDYYLKYREIEERNDSIKNTLVAQWVQERFVQLQAKDLKSYNSKTLLNLKDNELIRFELKDFDDFYNYYYPTSLFNMAFGVRPVINYGYEELSASVIVDGNKLKLSGDLALDKEMTKYFKEIYSNKFNPKFYNFLDANSLGFISMNINSEAYLKHLPSLVNKVYAGMGTEKITKIVDLFTTMAEIALDEKAISKVMKGDHLFLVNGVTKMDVKYTDYEYDDDYNYTEVERSKTETVPQFMWMFTSEDTRIYEKLLAIGISEEQVIDNQGVYELKINDRSGIRPYVLVDKGIVYVSNDLPKLQLIKSGQFRGSGSKNYINYVKQNSMAMVFNTKQVPVLMRELDIPVQRSMESSVNDLEKYGDFYIISKKLKGNRAPFEIGLEFPNEGKNALSYFIESLNKITVDLKD